MSKGKKIAIILCSVFLVVVIAAGLIVGIILMDDRLDIEPGCYMRKTYGYIGNLNGGICSMILQIFVVNDADYSFLDLNKCDAYLSGDDSVPNPLTALNISYSKEEGHILTIDFSIQITPISDSVVKYSTLVFVDKTTQKEITLDIGLISIENVTKELDSFNCAYSPTLGWTNRLEYSVTVKGTSEKPITIKNFIFNPDMCPNASFNYPIRCEEPTNVTLSFDNPAKDFDLYIFNPIIVFQTDDEIEKYNTLGMVFTYNQSMTYENIIDYINSTYFGGDL